MISKGPVLYHLTNGCANANVRRTNSDVETSVGPSDSPFFSENRHSDDLITLRPKAGFIFAFPTSLNKIILVSNDIKHVKLALAINGA